MTNIYFDPSGVDMTAIDDGETIHASDVRTPLENLIDAIETMDSNLNDAINNKAFASTIVAEATTTSTSYVQVSNASLTLNTHGGDVLVVFNGSFRSQGVDFLYIDLEIDGQRVNQGTQGAFLQIVYDWDREAISPVHLFRNVSAGQHTFNLLWKITGSGGINPPTADAKVAEFGTKPLFWAREL